MNDDRIREILGREFGLETDIAGDAKLFSSGRLDSLNSIRLLMSLETEFGVKVSPLDVSIEDIDSIAQIDAMVSRLAS